MRSLGSICGRHRRWLETRFDEGLLAQFEKEVVTHRSEESSSGLCAFRTHCCPPQIKSPAGSTGSIAAEYDPLVRPGVLSDGPNVRP